VRPTRAGTLLALAIGAGLVAYGAVDLFSLDLPPMPWTLPVALLGLALGVVFAALALRRRLHGAPGAKPIDPLAAARTVVLAKACSHAGALLGGAYAGLALYLVLEYDSDERRTDALVTGLSALAAAALVAAALLLERFCRVPPSDDDMPPAPSA
jgi:hypothetical protein